MDRGKLFDEVWSNRARRVGASYRMSEHRLLKWCRDLHIPLPPPQYWRGRPAGLSTDDRPPLPPDPRPAPKAPMRKLFRPKGAVAKGDFRNIEATGLSQVELAAVFGVSPPRIRSWLTGKCQPIDSIAAHVRQVILALRSAVKSDALPLPPVKPRGAAETALRIRMAKKIVVAAIPRKRRKRTKKRAKPLQEPKRNDNQVSPSLSSRAASGPRNEFDYRLHLLRLGLGVDGKRLDGGTATLPTPADGGRYGSSNQELNGAPTYLVVPPLPTPANWSRNSREHNLEHPQQSSAPIHGPEQPAKAAIRLRRNQTAAIGMFEGIEAAGLSQSELAALYGVTRVTVNYWLKGHAQPHKMIEVHVRKTTAAIMAAVKAKTLPLHRYASFGLGQTGKFDPALRSRQIKKIINAQFIR